MAEAGEVNRELLTQVGEVIMALEEKRIEPLEQQFAQLMVGYAELSAAFESLLWSLFGDGESDDAKAFRARLDNTRSEMMRWLNDAIPNVGVGGESLNEAVLRMVRDQPTAGEEPADDPGDGDGTPG